MGRNDEVWDEVDEDKQAFGWRAVAINVMFTEDTRVGEVYLYVILHEVCVDTKRRVNRSWGEDTFFLIFFED